MKEKIHPTYHQAKVVCACGNTFTVGSTLEEIHTEICSNCHPFYTGKQNLIDTAGRVERFEAMVKKSAAAVEKRGKKAATKKRLPKAERDTEEMLKNLKKELANQSDAQ